MKRHDILKEIDRVQAEHCSHCELVAWMDKLSTCRSCPVGQELQKLGAQLEGKERSYQPILDKGEDMTFGDIDYLRGLDVKWDEIVRHTGISRAHLSRMYSERNRILEGAQ